VGKGVKERRLQVRSENKKENIREPTRVSRKNQKTSFLKAQKRGKKERMAAGTKVIKRNIKDEKSLSRGEHQRTESKVR